MGRFGFLLDLIEPIITTFYKVLVLALKLTWKVLVQLLTGLLGWFLSIHETSKKNAKELTDETAGMGISYLSRLVYALMYFLTFVEIIIVSVVLAHILVFAIFAAVLYL